MGLNKSRIESTPWLEDACGVRAQCAQHGNVVAWGENPWQVSFT